MKYFFNKLLKVKSVLYPSIQNKLYYIHYNSIIFIILVLISFTIGTFKERKQTINKAKSININKNCNNIKYITVTLLYEL